MSGRAECVMLNKGPHVVDPVTFLRDVLDRMRRHQQKKQVMLRKLRVSSIGGWEVEVLDSVGALPRAISS